MNQQQTSPIAGVISAKGQEATLVEVVKFGSSFWNIYCCRPIVSGLELNLLNSRARLNILGRRSLGAMWLFVR